MVRAKFRVMEITQRTNGRTTAVKLLPVIAKPPKSWGNVYVDPEACEENRAFWEATPSGEAELIYKGFDPVPFPIESYVYIDMMQLDVAPVGEERAWQLHVRESWSLDIELYLDRKDAPLLCGSIKMSIANEKTWPSFQGKALTWWDVKVSQAPGPVAPTD